MRKQSSQQLAEARKQGLIQPVTPESKKQGIVNPVFTTRGLLPDIKESEKGNSLPINFDDQFDPNARYKALIFQDIVDFIHLYF